jgi:hypothetical protein
MPLDREDRFFGSKKGSANKALSGLVKHYGYAEGHRVYYAMLNQRKQDKKTWKPSR